MRRGKCPVRMYACPSCSAFSRPKNISGGFWASTASGSCKLNLPRESIWFEDFQGFRQTVWDAARLVADEAILSLQALNAAWPGGEIGTLALYLDFPKIQY